MVSPCRVTADVGAFHLSSQVDSGSTRMISLFMAFSLRRMQNGLARPVH
jgi:hypothetical protein